MKRLLWGLLLVVLLAVGGLTWWLHTSLDAKLADALRTLGPQITGVSVKVDRVSLEPLQGVLTIAGLELGNPQGFKTERAIALGQVRVAVEVGTLTQAVVHVREIMIDQPTVTYEYASGTSNLDAIARNVQTTVAQWTGDAAKSSPDQGRKLIVDQLVIRGGKVGVSSTGLQGKTLVLPMSEVQLHDVGRAQGGVTPAQLAQQLVGAVTQAVKRATIGVPLEGAVEGVKHGVGRAVDAVKGLFK